MSFVINTTVDKNAELLEAYKSLYRKDVCKDVFLISKSIKIPIDSFALALSSDFFKTLLSSSNNLRDETNIIIPDVEPEILRKVVEYIYNGYVSLDSKYMADFIEACNLLALKATISCERKLVFDSASKPGTSSSSSATFTVKSAPAAPVTVRQNQLDTLIADLEHEESHEADQVEYHLKQEISDSGQILEVYEISNMMDDDGIEYAEDNTEDYSEAEERYELINVSEVKEETQGSEKLKKMIKGGFITEIKQRTPAKPVDEETMNNAIQEVLSNTSSFKTISEKYQIPKTLLWRRAKKVGYVKSEKQKDSIRMMAIEAIKQGESLISLSKKFNIPISTLHREKLKLYERGQLPDNVNLKSRSRGEDYDDRLRIAITEILNGKTQNEVAKRYMIPKTTIWRIFKKNPVDRSQIGPDPVSTDSEIVDHLLQLSKRRSVNVKEEPLEVSQIEIKME